MPEQAETSNAARPHLDPAQYAARLDERALLASFLRFFAGLGLGTAAGTLIEPTLGPWIGLVCGGVLRHPLLPGPGAGLPLAPPGGGVSPQTPRRARVSHRGLNTGDCPPTAARVDTRNTLQSPSSAFLPSLPASSHPTHTRSLSSLRQLHFFHLCDAFLRVGTASVVNCLCLPPSLHVSCNTCLYRKCLVLRPLCTP